MLLLFGSHLWMLRLGQLLLVPGRLAVSSALPAVVTDAGRTADFRGSSIVDVLQLELAQIVDRPIIDERAALPSSALVSIAPCPNP